MGFKKSTSKNEAFVEYFMMYQINAYKPQQYSITIITTMNMPIKLPQTCFAITQNSINQFNNKYKWKQIRIKRRILKKIYT